MKALLFVYLIFSHNHGLAVSVTDKNRVNNFIPFEKVILSRKGNIVNSSYLQTFPYAHFGFIWDEQDNNDKNWRPQGITGFEYNNKQYLLVSWYNKKRFLKKNYGARLSLVKIHDEKFVSYDHILLLNENSQPIENIHAGGIAYHNDTVYLTDSRKNQFQILEFDIHSLQKPTDNNSHKMPYVIKQKNSWPVTIKPSFMSLNPITNDLLIGSFYKCKNIFTKHTDIDSCSANNNNALLMYNINNGLENKQQCFPLYSEMQGASTMPQPNKKSDAVWIVSSWGRMSKSHLHIGLIDWEKCKTDGANLSEFTVIEYPPGLENIYISLKNEAWLLTEFGPHEGHNNRTVFSIYLEKIMPE